MKKDDNQNYFTANNFKEILKDSVVPYLDFFSIHKLSITCRKFRNIYLSQPADENLDKQLIKEFNDNKKNLLEKRKEWEEKHKQLSNEEEDHLMEEVEFLINNLNEFSEESEIENFEKIDEINLIISRGLSINEMAWYKICGLLIKCYKYENKIIRDKIKSLIFNMILSKTEMLEFHTEGIYGNIIKLLFENLTIKSYFSEIELIIEEWGLARVISLFEMFYEILQNIFVLYHEKFDKKYFKYFFKFLIFSKHKEILEIQQKTIKLLFYVFPSELYINQVYKRTEVFIFVLKYYGGKWPEIVCNYFRKIKDVIKFTEKLLKNDDKVMVKFFKSSLIYNNIIESGLQDVYFAVLFKKKYKILYKLLQRQKKYEGIYKTPLGELRRKSDNTNLLYNALNLRGCVHKIISTLFDEYIEANSEGGQICKKNEELEEILNMGISHKIEKVREVFENFEI